MSFPISAALLDAIVLSVVAQEPEGTYGYRITQQVTHPLELSESTLYPVLRRLQKDQLLTVYDAPVNGRNRRYYQITPAGRQQLAAYAQEWSRYRSGSSAGGRAQGRFVLLRRLSGCRRARKRGPGHRRTGHSGRGSPQDPGGAGPG